MPRVSQSFLLRPVWSILPRMSLAFGWWSGTHNIGKGSALFVPGPQKGDKRAGGKVTVEPSRPSFMKELFLFQVSRHTPRLRRPTSLATGIARRHPLVLVAKRVPVM